MVPQRPDHVPPTILGTAVSHLSDVVADRVTDFALHEALAAIWNVVAEANRYVTETEPWSLVKRIATTEDAHDKKIAQTQLDLSLHELAAALETIARVCWPFMPETSEKVLAQLGLSSVTERRALTGRRVYTGEMLFPK